VKASPSSGFGIGAESDEPEVTFENLKVLGSAFDGIRLDGPNQRLIDCSIDSNNIDNDDVRVTQSDTRIRDTPAESVRDSGTRPVWNGVIGGGPLDGVDIGSLTGANTGDMAKADGTTATNADSLWVLKSNGDWQRVDGGATITPS
jgi:hypothetical protein